MKILFLFLDGVGLGADDPQSNPFARQELPTLQRLLGGRRLLAGSAPYQGPEAALLALDACLGVDGVPQSATGQAALLTGQNIPQAIGGHFGPKPNEAVAASLRNGNLFHRLIAAGKRASFLNAYPPAYFEGVASGRRLYSALPLAAVHAGLPLHTAADLQAGRALSADFTGRGWEVHLRIRGIPVYTPPEAGRQLARLAAQQDFALFEYWLSDYAGHGQDMEVACQLLRELDGVLEGLLQTWDPAQGLILITSDHGNLEDLSTRRHTLNPVPALVIGQPALREPFLQQMQDLTDITPAICRALLGGQPD